LLLAVVALAAVAPPSPGCPFCNAQGKTLSGELADASMVLCGTLSNPNEKAETTDIAIDTVIKDNPGRGKRMNLTLNRVIELGKGKGAANERYIVFCDLFKGKIDPYRGIPIAAGNKLPEYLRGTLGLAGKTGVERLRFFFDYLDSGELEISNDAYKEFGNADYKDFTKLAKTLPAERVIKWLKDADTPSFRIGLYASMLGHAGKEKDAGVLKALLDDPERRAASGVDGLLAAYAMLKPKDGWAYLLGTLKNTKEEFMFRYAALRAVRFLHDYRTDVVSKKDLVAGVCVLLGQEDIADLAIEDLRKWGAWGQADKVLGVCKTPAYKLAIVKRAVLRYCLQCKGNAAADRYVAGLKKEDPDKVKEALELLQLEAETTPTTTAKADAKKK
jgi:hypothetical protein